MELTHTARVPVPVDRAWEVAGDLPLLASALSGAELTERDGDTCRGTLFVKVGPITARYGGSVTISWRDEDARRVVLDVEGDEIEGVGRVEATINLTLYPEGLVLTRASVVTNLTLTGRGAQFGRGVLADVGQRLLANLVKALEDGELADDIRTTAFLDLFEERELVPAEEPEWEPEPEWEREPEPEAEAEPVAAAPEREGRRDRRRRKREALREMAAEDAAEDLGEWELAADHVEAPAEPEVVPMPEPEPEREPVDIVRSSSGTMSTGSTSEPEPEVEPEPEIVPIPVPEPEVVPIPEPAPEIVPQPEPVPEPEPEPEIVPIPEPVPEPEIVPPAEPEPEVLPAPEAELVSEPEPETEREPVDTVRSSSGTMSTDSRVEPEPEPEPVPRPDGVPSPLAPVDVIAPAGGAPEVGLAQKAAPYVLFLALLWLLRRMFGSSDD